MLFDRWEFTPVAALCRWPAASPRCCRASPSSKGRWCALGDERSACTWSMLFNSAFSVTSRKYPLSSLLRFTVAVTLMSLAFTAIFARPAAAVIALPKQAHSRPQIAAPGWCRRRVTREEKKARLILLLGLAALPSRPAVALASFRSEYGHGSLPSGYLHHFAYRLHDSVGRHHTVTTTFPTAGDSRYRWASTIWSSGNVLAMSGCTWL